MDTSTNTNIYSDIFGFITSQEALFKTPIQLPGAWNWSMEEHLRLSYLYNNSQLSTGKDDFKPVKNITRPILNLQHRAEDIDLKDVQIYVDDPDSYHLSFLIKKYHDDVFVAENDLDTFFDELNVSRIDYGGGLSKALSSGREVIALHSIAFCDQTDILSGPIGLKHFFSPSQLQDMASKGWGDAQNGATATIEQTIVLARESKREIQNNTISNTPGRYVEVYEVHGDLPRRFLDPEDTSELFSRQMHIVAFYTTSEGKKKFITLFHSEEKENPFKLIKRDPIYGRGLGFGGAEELFEPQVWTNYDMIRMQDMLDAAAKTIMITSDKNLVARHPNGMKDMDNMEFVHEEPNSNTRQMDTFPRNLALFERSTAEWEVHAKNIGGSQDPLQGKEAPSGTPFSAIQAQIQQGMGLHEYRRGQFAKHIEEIYRDDYIPQMIKAITNGTQFLSELSLEEMQMVSENVANNEVNKMIITAILNGNMVTQDDVDNLKKTLIDQFMKAGNKKFIEILKGEFKDKKIKVKVNVAGKSKNLPQMVDKLVNVFKTIIANPYMLQSPPIAKLFNKIIEASGLDPIDLSGFNVPPMPMRRMTMNIDEKDLPPDAQQAMLEMAGIHTQGQGIPSPIQPNQPVTK